jgi:transcriptional antiterminator RfaH
LRINMNQIRQLTDGAGNPDWFCVRCKPKHEHIAAAHLRRMVGEIEVFSPRLRIRRLTRRGAVWFVEAMFGGYVFARFPVRNMQSVKSTPGVVTVVSFGTNIPTISHEVIEGLRIDFDHNELHEVQDELQPGDEITIASGPFQGFTARFLRVLSSKARVQVLLEMLGCATTVELAQEQVLTQKTVAQLMGIKQIALAG